jgi:hypothetical protein
MRNSIRLAIVLIAAMGLGPSAAAQMAGGPGGLSAGAAEASGLSPHNHMGRNNMTQAQFDQLSEYVDQAKRLTKDDKAAGKTTADLKKEDMAAALGLIKGAALPCQPSDAVLASKGKATVAGKSIPITAYEVACADGMGYFLISGGRVSGFSCFTAQARNALDVKQGKMGDITCQLPANASIQKIAQNLLSHLGDRCQVKQVSWMGADPKTNTEYNEAACGDGAGYVLITPEPGSLVAPRAMSCAQAAREGFKCTMTRTAQAAAPGLTVQSLRDALASRGIACSNSKVRVIGQQNMSKRYVVEFQCPEQPKGLVALIPLNGNAAPFETYNCKTVTKLGTTCKLNAASHAN